MKLRLTRQAPVDALTIEGESSPRPQRPASGGAGLRCEGDEQVIKGMVSYVREFGRGSVALELLAGETVLWLHDESDVELVKNQFAELVTDWNGYTA